MSKLKLPHLKVSKVDRTRLLLELIVVFLGVTAGFLLNNWREGKVEHKLAERYIESFRTDIQQNNQIVDSTLTSDSLWVKETAYLIEEMIERNMEIDSPGKYLQPITEFSRLYVNTGTYEDMKSSGNLKLIKDFEVRKALINYYLEIEEASLLDDYFYDIFTNILTPHLMAEYNFITGQMFNEKSFNKGKIGNMFIMYYGLVIQRQTTYKELVRQGKSLIKKLEK